MNINDVIDLVRRVHDAEGMDFGSGSTRESRNAAWARLIGIVHFGHPQHNSEPDPQWHLKSAGGGRPQSDDVVVSLPSRDFWDCIPSAGADGYSFRATAHGRLPDEQPVFAPPQPEGGGVPQPNPEPQPQPNPQPGRGPMHALRSFHGTFVTFEQSTGLVAGDRTDVKAWEKARIIRDPSTPGWGWIEDGFGHNLLTDDDGNVTFGHTDDQSRKLFGLWERDGKLSIQSGKTRKWLRMGAEAESFWVHFNGPLPQFEGDPNNEPGDYETFTPEEVTGGGTGTHPFPLGAGILRARGDGYFVGGRATNALGFMAGDLVLCHSEGKDIGPALDAGMRAGYGYVGPTWNPLVRARGEGGPFWPNRALSPFMGNGFDWWYDVSRSFCRMAIDRGMKIFMANGGLDLFSDPEETRVYEGLRDLQSELGAEHFFMTGYVNEPRDTSSDPMDREPREIERLVNIIRNAHPDNQYGLGSYTGDTAPADVARFTMPWMDSWCTYHGYRDGGYVDKLRHLQNHHYESFTNIRPCFVNDEDFGPQGRHGHLSVQRNDHELDKHVMILAASIAMQGRCAYSFTCSPGILYDEPFEDIPGFMEVPGFVNRHVPPDIGTYEHFIHSGVGKDEHRVFRAQGNLRVDGRVRSDGHFYLTAYAPPNEVTSEIELDKSAEFDLINTDEHVWHFSLGSDQRIPDVPVEKGYVLRGRVR